MRQFLLLSIYCIFFAGFTGCDPASKERNTDQTTRSQNAIGLPEVAMDQRVTPTNDRITNLEAPIPSQCYTKTEGQHNPCYTCHQIYDRNKGFRMNELDDGALQGTYIFSDEGLTNHWKNLFIDKQSWQKQITDETIQAYVELENYSELAGNLAAKNWQGFIPDLKDFQLAHLAFDDQGLAKDGSYWVAFNYKPFPGTFWPTNGATDDVVIRLPKQFREVNSQFNSAVYYLNLSLTELNIKQLSSIDIPPTDEKIFGRDIDGDGQIAMTTQLHTQTHYFGDAAGIGVVTQQYPENTEFMHSVRYLGISDQDAIVIPPRMKELRYMKKIRTLDSQDLRSRYARERKEKSQGELPNFNDHGELGMENGFGWMLQGFIEDYDGKLRPQSREETLFCMGCHASIGATIDQTFAFARKVSGKEGWRYINLKAMSDAPSISESGGEIFRYLERSGGGSEFRENPEMRERWYDTQGKVDAAKVNAADVYTLIAPSKERALALNKAYTYIVRHQSYIDGRDSNWIPAKNVFSEIDESVSPLAPEFRFYDWDIRLDWNATK
jgi:hypothetical protein